VRRSLAVVVPLLPLLLAGAGCSGSDADDDGTSGAVSVVVHDGLCLDAPIAERPVVELIPDAIEVVANISDTMDAAGAEPEFYEISADRQRVSLIVAAPDGTAQQVLYCGGGQYVPASSLGEASGATFEGSAVDVDLDVVFDQLDEELDDPDIADFAIVGDGEGGVLYDATVQSTAGGALLVRLSADGAVLAVQAR